MNKKVVLIEGDPWLGEHFGQLLAGDGFKVKLVSDAYAAMDAINDEQPEVICMSLTLSGANGLSLLHELQSYTDTAAIPVVVWGNRTSQVDLEDLRPYGVRRLLDVATMEPADLPATLRSVLA